ncbi:MAG: PhoH family protein [Bacillota bacterium]|nr:PhoH family protein [Bacillota bacterium]
MKKTFVLDTSVLLHEAEAMFAFEDNTVVIPIAVVEEVDNHKRRLDEIGRNARKVSHQLDELRSRGKLNQGVELEGGGTLRVELNHQSADILPASFDRHKVDNRILAVALSLQAEKVEPQPVILVSKDLNMRVKADSLGLLAQDFERNKVQIEELYSGNRTVRVSAEVINRFYSAGALDPRELGEDGEGLSPNEFVLLEDEGGTSQSGMARLDKGGQLVPLRTLHADMWGIKARNKEQRFAVELLLNDDVRLVTLVGRAGTGKTLLALAAGLQKVAEENAYRKLLVSRPVVPMGNDLGFLPGDMEEKLRPWMQPLHDNLELIFANREGGRGKDRGGNPLQNLRDLGLVDIEALTYIRGRSIPGQFFILDEAQNLTPHEVKTVITRVGEGTKIVLTGDPYQIDHPYLDSSSNGLTYVVEKFKGEPIAGHITLTKGERSELAEMAAQLL